MVNRSVQLTLHIRMDKVAIRFGNHIAGANIDLVVSANANDVTRLSRNYFGGSDRDTILRAPKHVFRRRVQRNKTRHQRRAIRCGGVYFALRIVDYRIDVFHRRYLCVEG